MLRANADTCRQNPGSHAHPPAELPPRLLAVLSTSGRCKTGQLAGQRAVLACRTLIATSCLISSVRAPSFLSIVCLGPLVGPLPDGDDAALALSFHSGHSLTRITCVQVMSGGVKEDG